MRLGPLSTIAGRMLTALFLVCIGVLAVAYVQGQNLDVVYVPTPRETVDRMLQVAEVGPKDYVIDLGSATAASPLRPAALVRVRSASTLIRHALGMPSSTHSGPA